MGATASSSPGTTLLHLIVTNPRGAGWGGAAWPDWSSTGAQTYGKNLNLDLDRHYLHTSKFSVMVKMTIIPENLGNRP